MSQEKKEQYQRARLAQLQTENASLRNASISEPTVVRLKDAHPYQHARLAQLEKENKDLRGENVAEYKDKIKNLTLALNFLDERAKHQDIKIEKFREILNTQGTSAYNMVKSYRKCPVCEKTSGLPIENSYVKDVPIPCRLCNDRLVEIYFPVCGHIPVCSMCVNQLQA